MPKPKNLGPCALPDCENTRKEFRKLTSYTIEKIQKKDFEQKYNFLKENDQLCYDHYLRIVEPDRNKRRKSDNCESYAEASSSQQVNIEGLDWSKIKVNFNERDVTMSKDDFSILVDNITQMKLKLNEVSSDKINREADGGSQLIFFFLFNRLIC